MEKSLEKRREVLEKMKTLLLGELDERARATLGCCNGRHGGRGDSRAAGGKAWEQVIGVVPESTLQIPNFGTPNSKEGEGMSPPALPPFSSVSKVSVTV